MGILYICVYKPFIIHSKSLPPKNNKVKAHRSKKKMTKKHPEDSRLIESTLEKPRISLDWLNWGRATYLWEQKALAGFLLLLSVKLFKNLRFVSFCQNAGLLAGWYCSSRWEQLCIQTDSPQITTLPLSKRVTGADGRPYWASLCSWVEWRISVHLERLLKS